LNQGQSIDQDPVTGYRTYVEYKGPSNQGQPIVGIVEEGPGGLARWIYDAKSGELIGTGLINHITDGMTSVTITERTR
jgi:hypothetical protein